MFKISRREFVRISALTGAATVAAACANPTATPAPEATTAPIATTAPTGSNTGSEATPTTAASISSFSEAPMLAELVASGDLPPVEDRLPENPVVLPVKESLGVYGGTWRRAFRGTSDATGMTYLNWNSLTRFNEDLTIAPMLAESWDMNEDATVWTWHLRKGTKWSDGTPLTTEHTQWWWDNFANDKELNLLVSLLTKQALAMISRCANSALRMTLLYLYLCAPQSSLWIQGDLARVPHDARLLSRTVSSHLYR